MDRQLLALGRISHQTLPPKTEESDASFSANAYVPAITGLATA
jgi:hypothetical protein